MPEKDSSHSGRMQLKVVVLVFGLIFVYMLVTVILSLTRSRVSFFEAETGEITDKDSFTGFILRDEQLIKSPASGYISFYVNNGEKAARNEAVCLVKKASNSAAAKDAGDTYELTEADYTSIRQQLQDYRKTCSDSDFTRIRDLRYSLSNTVSQIVSREDISSADSAGDDGGIYDLIASPQSAVISYITDGMEGYTREDITPSLFSGKHDEKSQIQAGDYVKAGQDVCRALTSEEWQIIIRPDARQLEKIKSFLGQADSSSGSVTVFFPREEIRASADLELFGKDGEEYAALTLDNYLVRFAGERYADLELVWNSYQGFKIPSSALTKREYYMIPLSFLVSREGSSQEGFYTDSEDGRTFIKPGIAFRSNDYCYIDMDDIEAGTVLKDEKSEKSYMVSQTSGLDGIYTINQGYTRFCLVDILYSYGNYSIIENPEGSSSIKMYDRIVLDGDSVSNEQIIYN